MLSSCNNSSLSQYIIILITELDLYYKNKGHPKNSTTNCGLLNTLILMALTHTLTGKVKKCLHNKFIKLLVTYVGMQLYLVIESLYP